MRIILAAGALALGITAAIAQANVIEQRQDLMKQFGAATRTTSGMLRGEAPFDLSKVQGALRTYSNAKELPHLFPENSKSGKTAALPVIWENKAEFDALASKMDKDVQTALASIKDEATFKAEAPKVLQNCGACHNKFRQKQS
jgi:cytochrome c556